MNPIEKNTTKKQTMFHRKLLCPKSGYDLHTNPTDECRQIFKTITPKDTPIFNVLWNMKKNGMAYDTIRNVDKALSALSQRCDLTKPELVKATIAEFKSDGYKRNLTYAYNKYAEFYGLEWEKPKYWQPQKIPKIPLEKHIEAIIANSSIKTATALAISKSTSFASDPEPHSYRYAKPFFSS